MTDPCLQSDDLNFTAKPSASSSSGHTPPDGVEILQTSRRIAGRRFLPTGERSLVPDALIGIRSIPGAHSGIHVLEEAGGPFGIPDFVVLVGGLNNLRERRLTSVPPILNPVDADIIAAASPKRPLRSETLARRAKLSLQTVERRMRPLLRSGAISRMEKSTFLRSGGLDPLGRIVAVEMKLKDWRRALWQCRRYSLWTDGYVLVMGSVPRSAEAELLTEVASDGGGLVVSGAVLLRPRLRSKSPGRRVLASEHVFAALGSA